MSTEHAPPGGAPAAEEADHPPVPSEPGAAGKPSDGAADQERAETETHHDEAPAASEQSLTEELTGDAEPTKDDPPPPPADGADDPPPQPEAQKSQEQPEKADPAQQSEEQKTAKDDGSKPLTDAQEKAAPNPVRARIKNLERQLEQSTTVVRELETRAIKAGYQTADDVLAAIDVFGRAVHRRDPEALAEIDRRLQAAGLKREAPPAPAGIPAAKVRELLKAFAYDDLEKLAAEAEASPPDDQAPPKQPQRQPPAKPEAQEQPKAAQPAPDPVALQAVGAMQALASEIRAQHGTSANDILAEISAEVAKADKLARDRTGNGLLPATWPEEFRTARDAILARRREAGTRRPPTSLRSSTTAGNRSASSSPLTDELIADE